MVEKRQVRSGENTSAEDARDGEILDTRLERLPGDIEPLKGVKDDPGSELLDLAERQVAEARKLLGANTAKPRLKRIKRLFDEAAGNPPPVSAELNQTMRGLALAGQVAGFDGTYDHAIATAHNMFDKASVQSGAAVQIAYDDWTMAVRVFQSERRSAGAVLAAANETARRPPVTSSYDQPLRGESQADYYSKADKIGGALLIYERRLQAAGSALAQAYGALIVALYGAIGTLGVAESTLISVTQTASKTFWTSVQNAVEQIRD